MTTQEKLFWALLGSWLVLVTSPAHAQTEAEQITSIVWAEETKPSAVQPILDTYNKSRKHGESLLHSLQRQSCGYRFKSKQYIKAFNGLKIPQKHHKQDKRYMSKYEFGIYQKMLVIVQRWTPAPQWVYIKHESIQFYDNYETMVNHLRVKWGNNIDYVNSKLITGEYYFKLKGV